MFLVLFLRSVDVPSSKGQIQLQMTYRTHGTRSYAALSVFHKAINLLPANTQIREIQVFLESVLEEKAGRKRFDQVLKSLLQAEFLRVRLHGNSLHFLLKMYSVFLRSFCQITQFLEEKSKLLLEDAILQLLNVE